MRIDKDTVEEVISTITSNRSRSLLTAFGVFWGIFMLVSLVGGGNGLQDMMKANFAGFATNSCFVFAQNTSEAYKGFRKGRRWRLTNDDITRLRESVEEIEVITPTLADWGKTAVHGDKKYACSIKGLVPEYDAIENQKVIYGRFLNDLDMRDSRKVCVLGKRVSEALFGNGENPCGSYVRVDGIYYQVVGVVGSNDNINISGNASEQVIIPITIFQSAYNYGNVIDVVNIKMKPGCKVSEVKPKIEAVVKSAHMIAPNDPQAVAIFDAEELFSMMDNLFIGIKALVLLVGIGTLLAGIIGVSNIMMVSVRERTVEIGIRRAIGARPRDIMQQILSESVVLTFVAGMFGISAGVGLLSICEKIGDKGYVYGFQVSFGTAIAMLFVIIALGLVAGLAPAYRAMAIKPVDAMRDE